MGSFEVSVDPLSVFRSGDEPSRLAAERASWTCAIENGVGMFGTGTLIHQDLVLTNYHVIKGLLAEPARYGSARCRFDFHTDSDTGEVSEGRAVAFAQDWAVAWSEYSRRDEAGADSGFEPDRLDYAIIRLAAKVGLEPNGRGVPRGWMTLPAEPRLPGEGDAVSIWQHPVERPAPLTPLKAMPLKWSPGKVLQLLDTDLRLRHSAETFKGSSGAAIFDMGYSFVALHHAGDPDADIDYVGKWNQAIPATALVRHLRASGFGHLVGAAPPVQPRSRPPPAAARSSEIAADIAERRIRAATILMDRDAAERDLCYFRGADLPNRGIVHVLACRHVDSHRNFLERVARWSLVRQDEDLDAMRARLDAFLGTGAAARADEPWLRESLTWPTAEVPLDFALDMVKADLSRIARSQRRVVVEAAVPIDRIKPAREKRLVPAVAKLASAISSADRLQLFVVYYDPAARSGPDRTKKLRAELGSLWTLRSRPPGAGLSLVLDEIGSVELEAWCRALQNVWRTGEGEIVADVEAAFSARRMPMLEAEKKLAPLLRRYVGGEA